MLIWRWSCCQCINRLIMESTREGDSSGIHLPQGDPHTYHITFPTAERPQEFPFKGCRGLEETRTVQRVNFFHRHVRYIVVISEEGKLPDPWCPSFGIMVTWVALNGCHTTTAQCTKVEEQIRRCLEAEEMV